MKIKIVYFILKSIENIETTFGIVGMLICALMYGNQGNVGTQIRYKQDI